MTADVLPVSAAEHIETPQTVAAAATVWATVSVLDEIVTDPHGCATAQTHVDLGLRQLGLSKTDLYDHIVEVVEDGDWFAMGVEDGVPDD